MSPRALALSLALLTLSAGCESRSPRPPPRPVAAVRAPEELLPGDLDLVVRVDLARLRSSLGDPDLRELLSRVPWPHDGLSDSPLLLAALARSGALWLGFRGLPGAGAEDAIVVATGDFGGFDPGELEPGVWQRGPGIDPGASVFERASRGPRSSLAWGALLRGDTLVAATSVEVDPLRRVLERGADAGRLSPPADGLVGLSGRARAFGSELPRRFPALGGLLREVTGFSGVFDLEPGAMRADVQIAFRSPENADRGERVARALLESLGKEGAAEAQAIAAAAVAQRESETSLRLRVRASGEQARRVLGLSPREAPSPLAPAEPSAPPAPEPSAPLR